MNREVHVRFWESVGLGCPTPLTYLHAYKTVSEARAGIGRYLTFYNGRRPHSSLDRQTPDQALLQRAGTNDGGGIIEAEIRLMKRLKLFKQTGPPLNLAFQGIDSDIRWNDEGSFHRDELPDLKADFILANPPFNISDWGGERLAEDSHWKFVHCRATSTPEQLLP